VAFQDLIGFQVAKIKYEQNLMEKESWQKMQKIDDEIHLAKEKSKTDAEFYKVAYLQVSGKIYSPDNARSKLYENGFINECKCKWA